MKDKTVLVTGGAGYVGSHTVRTLAEQGYTVVVLDNLVYGHRDAILSPEVKLIVGEVGDKALVKSLFAEYSFTAVIHFAAYTYVGESVTDPAKYYQNNLAAPLVLLDSMRAHGCEKFILSSTCATYGNPQYVPIDEKHAQNPITPYGASKFMLEKILSDYDRAYGIRSLSLRYFNASGAAEDGALGEDHEPETHLIPLVLMAAVGINKKVTVFGTDYATPDGTCIRDYIHVLDLAAAHVQGLDYLDKGKPSIALNLGTGSGASVKEVIEHAQLVTGTDIPVEYGERRAGDPPELVADPKKAKIILGWEAVYQDVAFSISTAWNWMTGPLKGKFKQ